MRFIRHITITTGNSRDSFAGEVSQEALDACRHIVTHLSKTRQPVPGLPDYEINGARWGRSMVATIWRGDAPLVTLGVAVHSRDGAQLWRTLHTQAELPVETSPDNCPPEPWVAVLLHVGLALYPDAADWLGDFERCLAWAFYLLSQEQH
jgi:hypothetical protein